MPFHSLFVIFCFFRSQLSVGGLDVEEEGAHGGGLKLAIGALAVTPDLHVDGLEVARQLDGSVCREDAFSASDVLPFTSHFVHFLLFFS